MASLNEPEAVDLLARLSKLVAVADTAFRSNGSFVYPKRLGQLPEIVRQLQPFLDRRKAVRVPFWNCVKAVDERRKKLGLVSTLNEMVDRATSVKPGPLFRLLTEYDRDALNAQESDALRALDQHLKDQADHPPQNLKAFRSLLARVPSDEYRKLKGCVPAVLARGVFEDVLDYAAYLDFCQQHYRWIKRYQEPLEDLYGLLIEFNSDHLYRQMNRVMHGGTPKEANQKEWRRKAAARARVAKHRVKVRTVHPPAAKAKQAEP